MSEDTKDQVLAPSVADRLRCLDLAVAVKSETAEAADVVYIAAQFEAYVRNGARVQEDFECSVRAALAEVDHAPIAGVSEASKAKVMEQVRQWLRAYKINP